MGENVRVESIAQFRHPVPGIAVEALDDPVEGLSGREAISPFAPNRLDRMPSVQIPAQSGVLRVRVH